MNDEVKSVNEEERTKQIKKNANITLTISILALIFCYVPIVSTAGAIVAVVRAKKGKQTGMQLGKFKAAMIVGVIGIVLSVMFVILLFIGSPNKTYEMDGQKMELICLNSACEKLDQFGDNNATRILAEIGVRKVNSFEVDADNPDEVIVKAYEGGDASSRFALVITYNPEHTEVQKIAYQDFPDIVYYTTDEAVQTLPFPSGDKILEKRKAEKEEEEKKRAEEEAKAKAAAEAKAAEDARYPSEISTREFCEEVFHKQYPYNGSKVHSIKGVIALERRGENQMFYKVKVTIENAFGASYDQVMECTVRKDAADQMLRIDEFIVY